MRNPRVDQAGLSRLPAWRSARRARLLLAPLVAAAVAACLFAPAAALQQQQVLVPPDYSTLTPPPVGGTYEDPVFGTTIKRLTDASGIERGGYVPEYSQHSAFNLDDTYLVLAYGSAGTLRLYDGDGGFIRALTRIGVASEPRWSRVNPNWLYYHTSDRIRRLDVVTGEHVDIGVPFAGPITFGRSQGDVSDNERILVIRSQRYVSIYDLAAQSAVVEIDTGQAPLNGASFDNGEVAKDGNTFIINYNANGFGRGQGTEQYDLDGNFMAQLLNAQGHASMGRDIDGTPVLYMTNAGTNPQQPGGCDNGIVKISLDGGARRTCLMNIPWAVAKHISAHAYDGWVYVSTYQPGVRPIPAPPDDWNASDDDNWHVYTDEILRVRADGSRVERLAHHRSSHDSYWVQPHATVSISGRKLIYGSDFQLDLHPEYADTYLIDLLTEAEAAVPIALGPSGAITSRRPTYTWTRASGADRYLLWVEGPLGSVHSRWYPAFTVCSFAICSVTSPPVPDLNLGPHMFGIAAMTEGGSEVSGAPQAFNVGFRSFRPASGGRGGTPLQ